MLTLYIPLTWLSNINSNINYIKKNDNQIQIYDILTEKKYALEGKIINENIILELDEKYTAITSKWPDKLPKNLPFKLKVISKHNLGEPSMWRVARFVLNEETNEIYFLKLMPKDIIGNQSLGDKIDRVYKEINNQEKCKSKHVLSTFNGEYKNWIWSLQKSASKGNIQTYQNLIFNKIIPDYIALYLFKQIILGVKHIHSKNIYHNFLHTGTMLIDDYFNIKISDFGSSINKRNFTSYEDHYFTNMLPKFINYKTKMTFPPEWSNKIVYNEKTDIWHLGIILKNMVSNQHTVDISHGIKILLNRLLNKDPEKRITIAELLNYPLIKNIKLSNMKKLNKVTKEIKLVLFNDFFLEMYKNTFNFREQITKKYKDKYINANLLSFVKNFCYDEYTGWDSILKKIWYHDQATIMNKNWKNTIYITEFEGFDYFEICIADLTLDTLPERYHKFISNAKWKEFKNNFLKKIKKSNKYFNSQNLKPFEYSDLEVNEETYESLYSKPLLSNGTKVTVQGNKQVLSMLIKISSRHCDCFKSEGRTLPDKKKIDSNSLYIPIELCESDIISTIMATSWSEFFICKKRYEESFCYLTIRKSVIKPNLNQGVGGWHVDGAWGQQTYRHPNIGCGKRLYNGTFSDRNYLIQSSKEIKTPVAPINLDLSKIRKLAYKKYNKGLLSVLPTDVTDDLILHKFLTKNTTHPPFQPPGISHILDIAVAQSNKDIVKLPANKINFFTAYTIHKVPKNNTKKNINRTAIRVAFSADYFDKACGPTINPIIGIPGELLFFPYPKPFNINKKTTLLTSFKKRTNKSKDKKTQKNKKP